MLIEKIYGFIDANDGGRGQRRAALDPIIIPVLGQHSRADPASRRTGRLRPDRFVGNRSEPTQPEQKMLSG